MTFIRLHFFEEHLSTTYFSLVSSYTFFLLDKDQALSQETSADLARLLANFWYWKYISASFGHDAFLKISLFTLLDRQDTFQVDWSGWGRGRRRREGSGSEGRGERRRNNVSFGVATNWTDGFHTFIQRFLTFRHCDDARIARVCARLWKNAMVFK
jgi:hypothetical protein